MQSGFKGIFNTLNTTGVFAPIGELFDKIDEGFDELAEHKKSVGDIATIAGGLAAGIGATLATIGSKDAQAHAQLKTAIENSGNSWDDYEKQVDSTIKTQEKYRQLGG